MILISIKRFRALQKSFLIIASIELLFLFIHLISIISRFSYVFFRHMISIIKRFFSMIFNRIKHLYRDFEFMHTIISKVGIARIFFTIDLITASTSKL